MAERTPMVMIPSTRHILLTEDPVPSVGMMVCTIKPDVAKSRIIIPGRENERSSAEVEPYLYLNFAAMPPQVRSSILTAFRDLVEAAPTPAEKQVQASILTTFKEKDDELVLSELEHNVEVVESPA